MPGSIITRATKKKMTTTCRSLPASAKTGNVSFEATTCGKDAFLRGPGQKVVGFSFYGDINSNKSIEKGYFEGIVENLQLIRAYYPGKGFF